MRVNAITTSILKRRREDRDMTAAGWERVDGFSNKLWELDRGFRTNHVITEVKIGDGGRCIWIKTAPKL